MHRTYDTDQREAGQQYIMHLLTHAGYRVSRSIRMVIASRVSYFSPYLSFPFYSDTVRTELSAYGICHTQ